MFDPGRSEDFGPTIERKLDANPAGGFGLLFWIALILIARWRAKSWLIGIGGRKRMREATDSARKVAAGILTMLVAFACPAILYLVARWLGTGVVSESTLYASSGFYAASLVALMVEVPRQLLRHLGIREQTCRRRTAAAGTSDQVSNAVGLRLWSWLPTPSP